MFQDKVKSTNVWEKLITVIAWLIKLRHEVFCLCTVDAGQYLSRLVAKCAWKIVVYDVAH